MWHRACWWPSQQGSEIPCLRMRMGWHHFLPHYQHGGTAESNTEVPSGGRSPLDQILPPCTWQSMYLLGQVWLWFSIAEGLYAPSLFTMECLKVSPAVGHENRTMLWFFFFFFLIRPPPISFLSLILIYLFDQASFFFSFSFLFFLFLWNQVWFFDCIFVGKGMNWWLT